jgi:hypothetical protein
MRALPQSRASALVSASQHHDLMPHEKNCKRFSHGLAMLTAMECFTNRVLGRSLRLFPQQLFWTVNLGSPPRNSPARA